MHIEKPFRKKIDQTSKRRVFLGFLMKSGLFDWVCRRKRKTQFQKSKNVNFNENEFYFKHMKTPNLVETLLTIQFI